MSLRHLPMILIVSGLTRDMRSAIPPHRSEGAQADVLRREANGRAHGTDHGSDGRRDLVSPDCNPFVLVLHRRRRGCAGGAMTLKVCDAAKQGCQRTSLGMACAAVADGISLDTIFLSGE